MKKNFYLIAAFALLAAGLSSCQLDKDPVDYSKFYANALVTVKHNADNVFYLQLDDNTTVKPDNMEKSPFGDKQVRALANLTIKDDVKPEGDFDKTVTINWIDSVRTKDIVPSLGDLDDKEYGTDPIEIIGNWVTIVEDGYLTLSFCALWGNPSVAHSINLVSGVDPKNPYVLELRHNAMGDNYLRQWCDCIRPFIPAVNRGQGSRPGHQLQGSEYQQRQREVQVLHRRGGSDRQAAIFRKAYQEPGD